MQNRSPLSGQTQSEWFVAVGDQSIGPMTAGEVHDRILAGELTWVSFVWKEGMAEWARISEVPTFKEVMPPPPAAKPKARPPAPPATEKKIQVREWFLFYNESQYGPFTEEEVLSLISVKKVQPDSFVWKDGMSDWEKISGLAPFQSSFRSVEAPSSEKRQSVRKPILAKVLLVEGEKIIVGMARDISIGGMQVLSDFVPSKVGARLKLNVSSPDPNRAVFLPFVAEGVVVRIHDDRRGFSFRFDELSSSARQIIESIIQG